MKIIYVIPGLGTTKELFRYLSLNDTEIRCLDWPLFEEKETMQSLAEKMAKGIDETKPFYLMGVSLGGMLCTEIAEIRKPVKTILISSCKCRNEIPMLFRLFKYFPVYKWVPESQLRIMAKHSRQLLGFDRAFIKEFHQMIDTMKENYFKRAINCIINWDRTECSSANIIHIHGTSDRLLRYKKIRVDHTIKDGSHAMIVEKAEEISAIINKSLNL